MNRLTSWSFPVLLPAILLAACGDAAPDRHSAIEHHTVEQQKGPHGGRLLTDGDFTLELAIFETGVPPEYRAWITQRGQPLPPANVELSVTLTRLGDRVDTIGFQPDGDYLRGNVVIEEPHSFGVSIEATHDGKTHRWQYDSFEGRTTIGPEVAAALGVGTTIAGPATLRETITVYGRITADAERVRNIGARFDGVIQMVHPSLGDTVRKGQPLATVESNESLRTYTVDAPISGVITKRDANPGELTAGRTLFTIADVTTVWAELPVFSADRARVRAGMPVAISAMSDSTTVTGTIGRLGVLAEDNQAVTARVALDNAGGQFPPGTHVTAEVTVATHQVPLAVKRSALQAFRDFTVVYAQFGDQYEVRMLELGRQDREWVEVLGGLAPGTRYVSENSYVIKADIEKSGAAHDH